MKFTLPILLALLASACILAPMEDPGYKSGGGPSTVVCHKGKQTKELPQEAVRAHIDHGDTYGPCR